jgi:hypothetical protein
VVVLVEAVVIVVAAATAAVAGTTTIATIPVRATGFNFYRKPVLLFSTSICLSDAKRCCVT